MKQQSQLKGSCTYAKCGSACCKRFRIYRPGNMRPEDNTMGRTRPTDMQQGRDFNVPESEQEMSSYTVPINEWLTLRAKAGRGIELLLSWRGITIRKEGLYATYVFPHPVKGKPVPSPVGYAMQFEGLVCKYLRDNGTCAIQERKPPICKEFPLLDDGLPEGCGFSLNSKPNVYKPDATQPVV
jgi:Fe-S-cluster containining protein